MASITTSESSSTLFNSNIRVVYNPHSGRGRRRTAMAPPDQRTAQLRDSQRRHRERKLNYIRDLEARAAGADAAWARVSQLEEICVDLQMRLAQHQNVDETNQTIINEKNSSTFVNMFAPSATINGPLEIEYSREQLRCISNLAESPLVDKFFNSVKAQVACTDCKLLRKHILRTVNISSAILDTCGVIDRQKVYEIMAEFQRCNKTHKIYINQMAGSRSLVCSDEDLVLDNARVDHAKLTGSELWFRKSLTAINSLKGAKKLIDDLCDTSHSISIGGCAEERLFKVLDLTNTLKEMCQTEEEQKQFMIVTEIARYNNRKNIEDLLKTIGIN